MLAGTLREVVPRRGLLNVPSKYITRMMTDAIGLDIGGANLKAADATGRSLCRPFELWRHPDRLGSELARIQDEWGDTAAVAVTMTGELCDCFETKRDGVRQILAAVEQAFRNKPVAVWSIDGRFICPEEAVAHPIEVASANWHAQATFAGRFVPNGAALLVDTGSTTTDIIPLLDGKPAAVGRTDTERLACRELVYTGVRRTPLCALLGSKVAAELFATTLDAYVLLGLIPEDPEDRSTADGRFVIKPFARNRLARMIGGDREITPEAETVELAREVLAIQSNLIISAIRESASRLPTPPESFIVSGSGAWLAERALKVYQLDSPIERCIQLPSPESACAYALAILYSESRRCG